MNSTGPVAIRYSRLRVARRTPPNPTVSGSHVDPATLHVVFEADRDTAADPYLKGISTCDFSEGLAALLGKDAAGLSASAIGRLKHGCLDEHTAWQKHDLSAKRYVYIWAGGIHLEARLENEMQCILVLIGATPESRKELVGFTDGARESAHDWRGLLLDLKRCGLDVLRGSSTADGALGFPRRR